MPNEVPFGRYALLTKIASGGMAELFLARQRGPEGFEKLVATMVEADLAALKKSSGNSMANESRTPRAA